MKTYYISVPMLGREEKDILQDIAQAEIALKEKISKEQIINPYDIAKGVESASQNPSYGAYLGADIGHIVDHIDTLYFCRGWEDSKGCMLEYHTARIYGKEMIFG